VVRNDSLNLRPSDTIVAIITSSPRRFTDSGTQVRIDPSSDEGKTSGLRAISIVQCENLATIDSTLIQATIGHLPTGLMREVDQRLKMALGND
jgi:mRNA-degrading endonuclease toxin of MazEF toxin-antitoxin module